MIELSKDKVNMVVAHSRITRYIGKDGDLPWGRKISADLKFISYLSKHPDVGVIMGRRTYESINCKPLPGRVNVIISSQIFENVTTVRSYEEAVDYCQKNSLTIVVFGGTKVYQKAFEGGKYRLFCTIVDYEGDGDTVFPRHDTELKCISKEVNDLLKDGKWCYTGDGFVENGLRYNFYMGEK